MWREKLWTHVIVRLEHRVGMQETLVDRIGAVESQILQLRGDMSVLRTAMEERHEEAIHHADDLNAQTIRVVETLHAGTNQRMEALHAEMVHQMHELNAETVRQMHELNAETAHQMHELIAETRRHMLVLHEEVIDRIGRLGEGRDSKT